MEVTSTSAVMLTSSEARYGELVIVSALVVGRHGRAKLEEDVLSFDVIQLTEGFLERAKEVAPRRYEFPTLIRQELCHYREGEITGCDEGR